MGTASVTAGGTGGAGSRARCFLVAGLLFFLAGIGLAAATRLGTAGPPGAWAAAVHLLTAGWITFLIFGVNYQSVPVYSGLRFPRPERIRLHFLLSTVGVAASAASLAGGVRGLPAALAAGAELAGGLLFLGNLVSLFRSRLPYTPHPFERFLLAPGGRGPDRAATRFTRVSVGYLLAGLGLHLALALREETAGAALARSHLFLPGWALMMIYGVSYHLLPRLTGHPLRSEMLIRPHFLLANLGTAGLVLFLPGRPSPAAGVFGAATALGFYLYLWNISPTLRRPSPLPGPVLAFLRLALASLAAGVALGAFLAAFPAASPWLRPAHVWLNLLSGVSLLIFGTGYALFPRLAGQAGAPLAWVRLHLVLVLLGSGFFAAGTGGGPQLQVAGVLVYGAGALGFGTILAGASRLEGSPGREAPARKREGYQ